MRYTAQPKGKWTFDKSVVDNFDDMVTRSVPLYDEVLNLAARFSDYHQPKLISDLGCATGMASEKLAERNQSASIIAVDISPDMLEIAGARRSNISTVEADLRLGLPDECLLSKYFVSLYTMQFIPLEHRAKLFRQIFTQCKETGGGFFIAEKLRGQSSLFHERLTEQYHDWKHEQGFSVEQIAAKNRSLENSLVSYNAPELKQALIEEGFRVEEVIRYLHFGAWYCVPR